MDPLAELVKLDPKSIGVGQPCHPNVDIGFLGIALRVFGTNLSDFADRRLKQHDVNIVMVLRQLAGAESLECSTLHSASIEKSNSSSNTPSRP
jgi:hypothetical protein